MGQILQTIFNLYFIVKIKRIFPIFTNKIGNFLPFSYLFSEFIYVNPVINYNIFNDQIYFFRTGKGAGVTWDTSIFYFLAIIKLYI